MGERHSPNLDREEIETLQKIYNTLSLESEEKLNKLHADKQLFSTKKQEELAALTARHNDMLPLLIKATTPELNIEAFKEGIIAFKELLADINHFIDPKKYPKVSI